MSEQITCRPIDRFPVAETIGRKRALFKVTLGATLAELRQELRYLRAEGVVLELDVRPQDIRSSDGWPKVDAVVRTPRVVLRFESRYGTLCYPCDQYHRWEDNVRAIRLALEALRAVDRYGVTRRGEQFQGWKALSPGTTDTMSVPLACARFYELAGHQRPHAASHELLGDLELAYDLLVRARVRRHPDRLQGARALWDELETVWAIIEPALL